MSLAAAIAEAALRPIGARPFEAGKDAGKRSGIAVEAILDHRQAEGRERAGSPLALMISSAT